MLIDFDQLERILGSKAFENTAGVAGTLLSSAGQSRDDAANRAMNERDRARQILLNLVEGRRNDARGRAVAAAEASPLGEEQNFEARQRIAGQLLGGARNFNIRPQDPAIASLMPDPAGFGGMRIPEGGLDVSAFAPGRTADSIARRREVVNRIATPTVSGDEEDLEALLRQALDGDLSGAAQPQKKGGFWRTLGKIGAIAAPIVAAPFTGGASLALIGAGSGGALAALNGGGVRDIALGAGMGATAGLGARGGTRTAASSVATPTNDLMQQALRRRIANGVRF